ncbi:LpqB family beta-propeller domain-containing protein [Haloglycomyces albus]|uniref:LpqB family beta-propeller domain-containing protein n=1 Tax=Haloglycomyces albus TaxID=526067 RepID=UPI00046C9CA8|nr:LpqB family beta-propeller domain-containing protein [Haloglycomyces albus]
MVHGRRGAIVAFGLLAGLTVTSCGVPSDSSVEVVQDDPIRSSQNNEELRTPEPSTDAEDSVENFLRAAAGNDKNRISRLNNFTDEDLSYSNPADGIALLQSENVAPTSNSGLKATVEVTGRIIGSYLPDGQVRATPSPREYEESFELVRENHSDAWSIVSAPKQLTMLTSQFHSRYERAPLYFVATGDAAQHLVPDLRWTYRESFQSTNSVDQLLTQRFSWLLNGPSEFTRQSARSAIPSSVTPQLNVSEDGQDVHVNLVTSEVIDIEPYLEAIAAQLVWSLNISESQRLLLSIDDERKREDDISTLRSWNAIPSGEGNPTSRNEMAFYVHDSTVWQYSSARSNELSDTRTPSFPWVGTQLNGMTQMDVTVDSIAAVTADNRLFTATVGEAETDMQERLSADSLRDPEWIDSGTVLAIVDGLPSAINVTESEVTPLSDTEISRLSLAPDGRRLAYVNDGAAYLAPLIYDSDNNISLGNPKRIGHDIDEISDLDWASETGLWIAGHRDGRQEWLFEVSIDNAVVNAQGATSSTTTPADSIAARPADPTGSTATHGEPIMAVIDNTLVRVYSTTLDWMNNDAGTDPGSTPFVALQPVPNELPD